MSFGRQALSRAAEFAAGAFKRIFPPPRPDPGLTPVNIDYVWGFNDTEAQHWMPPVIWVAALMILLPAVLYAPVHFLLRGLMPKPMRAR